MSMTTDVKDLQAQVGLIQEALRGYETTIGQIRREVTTSAQHIARLDERMTVIERAQEGHGRRHREDVDMLNNKIEGLRDVVHAMSSRFPPGAQDDLQKDGALDVQAQHPYPSPLWKWQAVDKRIASLDERIGSVALVVEKHLADDVRHRTAAFATVVHGMQQRLDRLENLDRTGHQMTRELGMTVTGRTPTDPPLQQVKPSIGHSHDQEIADLSLAVRQLSGALEDAIRRGVKTG